MSKTNLRKETGGTQRVKSSILFLMLATLIFCLQTDAAEAAPAAAEQNKAKKNSISPVQAAKNLNPVAAAKAAKEKLTKSLKPEEPPIQIRDKWALIVGLEAFNDDAIRPVKFAQNNASLLSTFLASPELGKFGPSRVLIVTNNRATKNNVSKALGETWLLKNALPNDLIVMYFCTRAQRKADGSDLLLYMFDTPSSQPELGAIELKETLKNLKMRTQSKHILCLLDLGPLAKQKKGAAADESSEDVAPAADADDVGSTTVTLQQIATATGTTILAATDIGGRSYSSSTKPCSAFIENLLEGLSTSNGQVEFEQVAQYVVRMVRDKVNADFRKEQKPVFATTEESAPMLKTVVATAVKSSTPEKHAKIGHPPEKVATSRTAARQVTEIASSRSVSSKPGKKEEDDESYDDASFGNVDFGPYMDKMKKDIQAQWKPPKGFDSQKVIAVFSIKKDGTIANASIVDGSGNNDVDKSAMEALQAASPLDPLPPGSPPYVQIRYQFDWKVTKN